MVAAENLRFFWGNSEIFWPFRLCLVVANCTEWYPMTYSYINSCLWQFPASPHKKTWKSQSMLWRVSHGFNKETEKFEEASSILFYSKSFFFLWPGKKTSGSSGCCSKQRKSDFPFGRCNFMGRMGGVPLKTWAAWDDFWGIIEAAVFFWQKDFLGSEELSWKAPLHPWGFLSASKDLPKSIQTQHMDGIYLVFAHQKGLIELQPVSKSELQNLEFRPSHFETFF